MQHTDVASLIHEPCWYMPGEHRRLFLNGRRTGTVLPGEAISMQVAVGDRYLIATHCDYFDYVDHWFHVVSRDGTVLDRLSTPSYFGFVEKIQLEGEGDDCISLGFFGTNDRWTITMHLDGYWSLGFDALFRRPNRFLLSRRYLSARRVRGERWVFNGPA